MNIAALGLIVARGCTEPDGLEQVRTTIERHGDVMVPEHALAWPGLGNWVALAQMVRYAKNEERRATKGYPPRSFVAFRKANCKAPRVDDF